jgi:hypothetical protein
LVLHWDASKHVVQSLRGREYPNRTFTGFVPADSGIPADEITKLQGKNIDIVGTIELHKGKPEIKVLSIYQIAIRPAAGRAATEPKLAGAVRSDAETQPDLGPPSSGKGHHRNRWRGVG